MTATTMSFRSLAKEGSQDLASVRRHLDALLAQGREVGLQYAAVSDSAFLLHYAGGVRDAALAEPVTDQTLFLSASSTKVLTALALLQLAERGALSLQDPLSRFVPHQPYGDGVLLSQLLNHSSGVPNPLPLRWVHTQAQHAQYDERAILDSVLRAHPKRAFEPGARYLYSNLSYWLLGRVIETVSGLRYQDYLEQHVLAPLEIPAAELSCEIPEGAELARGHVRRWSALGLALPLMAGRQSLLAPAGKWSRMPHLYMNGAAYGGARATARAYGRFLQDMLRPRSRLLTGESREQFFAPQRDRRGRPLPTTLGWHTGELAGEPYLSKPGGGPGFNSNLRIYPRRRVASVYLSNQMRASEAEIQRSSDAIDRAMLADVGA